MVTASFGERIVRVRRTWACAPDAGETLTHIIHETLALGSSPRLGVSDVVAATDVGGVGESTEWQLPSCGRLRDRTLADQPETRGQMRPARFKWRDTCAA